MIDPCYLGASDFEAILAESVWGASKARFPTKIQKGWSQVLAAGEPATAFRFRRCVVELVVVVEG